jgi:AcrR family transcriptional regulator
VDGRSARRACNTDAVVEALFDLWSEGELEPDVASVARRSGVSERSIFRYFEDVAALKQATLARQVEREAGLFELPDSHGTLDERVVRLVALRLRQYDRLAPIARVAFLRAPFDPTVAEAIEQRRRAIRAQLVALFEPELAGLRRADRDELVAALEVATSFEALELLRTSRRRSPAAAGRVLARAVRALVGEVTS